MYGSKGRTSFFFGSLAISTFAPDVYSPRPHRLVHSPQLHHRPLALSGGDRTESISRLGAESLGPADHHVRSAERSRVTMSKGGQDLDKPQKQWMSHWKIKPAPRVAAANTVAALVGDSAAVAAAKKQQSAPATSSSTQPQHPHYTASAAARSAPATRPIDIVGRPGQGHHAAPRPHTPEISTLSASPGASSAVAGGTRPPLQSYVHHWKVDTRGGGSGAREPRGVFIPPATAAPLSAPAGPKPGGGGGPGAHPGHHAVFHHYQPPPQASPPKDIPMREVVVVAPNTGSARAPSPGRTHPYRSEPMAGTSRAGRQKAPHRATSPSVPVSIPTVGMSPGLQRTYPRSVGNTPPTHSSYLSSTPPMTDPMHPFNLLLSSVERQLKIEEEEEQRQQQRSRTAQQQPRKASAPGQEGIKEESSGSDTEPMADVDARTKKRPV